MLHPTRDRLSYYTGHYRRPLLTLKRLSRVKRQQWLQSATATSSAFLVGWVTTFSRVGEGGSDPRGGITFTCLTSAQATRGEGFRHRSSGDSGCNSKAGTPSAWKQARSISLIWSSRTWRLDEKPIKPSSL